MKNSPGIARAVRIPARSSPPVDTVAPERDDAVIVVAHLFSTNVRGGA